MKRKTIAIDMDGVLADVEAQALSWYERDFNIRLSKSDLLGKTEQDLFPEKDAFRTFVMSPGFFSSLPVMEGAVEAVKKLSERFDIYIVSAAMEFPLSLSEKYEWLKVHFSFISWRNIVFCGDKCIIDTDYMIDDHTKNLDHCKGKTIMFHAFHNSHVEHHIRANNWAEVLSLLETED